MLFIQYIFLLQSTVLASTSVCVSCFLTAQVTITDQPESLTPLMFGETVSLSCTASSIPIPGITWFQVQNGMTIQLSNESGDVTIVSGKQNETTMMSTLQLSLNNEMDFTEYFCHGDNIFSSIDSNKVQTCEFSSMWVLLAVVCMYYLCHGSIAHDHTHPHTSTHTHPPAAPNITVHPQDMVATNGEEITFTCQARGNPTPYITWQLIPSATNILTTPRSTGQNEVKSELVIEATTALNGTVVSCAAKNPIGNITSNNATLIVTGRK